MGRRPLGEKRRGLNVVFAVNKSERDELIRAAEKKGMSLSQWCRDVLLRSARRTK